MKDIHWLGQALLMGFLWIFLVVCSYLLLNALEIWQKLPERLTHTINIVTGLVLLGELIGHLAFVSGRLPERPAAD